MRCLSLQIQPDRIPQLNVAAVVKELTELTAEPNHSANVDVQEGNDEGRCINVTWSTRNYTTLWNTLQNKLEQDHQLSQCSIVCCEGQHGWDDYLLLHHYDSTQQLDELPLNEKK